MLGKSVPIIFVGDGNVGRLNFERFAPCAGVATSLNAGDCNSVFAEFCDCLYFAIVIGDCGGKTSVRKSFVIECNGIVHADRIILIGVIILNATYYAEFIERVVADGAWLVYAVVWNVACCFCALRRVEFVDVIRSDKVV